MKVGDLVEREYADRCIKPAVGLILGLSPGFSANRYENVEYRVLWSTMPARISLVWDYNLKVVGDDSAYTRKKSLHQKKESTPEKRP